MGGYTVDIIELIDQFTQSGMLFGIYLFVLVTYAFVIDKDEKNFRNSVIFPGIVMFLGVVFGITFVDKFVKNIVDILTHPRYTWIMCHTIVLSLVFTYFVCKVEGNVKKLLAIMALCVLVFCCGEHKVTGYVYKKPENLYKFPQSVVDITEKVTSEMEEPRLCVPISSAYPFRQISTKVHLLYGDDAGYGRIKKADPLLCEVGTQMETSQPDLYFITDICRKNDVDYIVLDQIYMEFGETNLNDEGYESSHTYIGDRNPVETESDGIDHSKELDGIKVVRTSDEEYWDLSSLGLSYDGTYGQYLLYRFD